MSRDYRCDFCERPIDDPISLTISDSDGSSDLEFCGTDCIVGWFSKIQSLTWREVVNG